jgi:hypothetical protein
MNLFKYFVSKKIFLFVFLVAVFFVFTPFNSANASVTTYIGPVLCGYDLNPPNNPFYCTNHIIMDKKHYTPGEQMNVEFWVDNNPVGILPVIKFGGSSGISNQSCTGSGHCKVAYTPSNFPAANPGNDSCEPLKIDFTWNQAAALVFPYRIVLQYEDGGPGASCDFYNNTNGASVQLSSNQSAISLGETLHLSWTSVGFGSGDPPTSCEITDAKDNSATTFIATSGTFDVLYSDISQTGTHTYDVKCYEYLNSLGFLNKMPAEAIGYFERLLMSFTPNAIADTAGWRIAKNQQSVVVSFASPPLGLTFALPSSGSPNTYIASIGQIGLGTIQHPNTTHCTVVSIPSIFPSGNLDCQKENQFENPFNFNVGPFISAGSYVFTAHGTYPGGSKDDVKTIIVSSSALPDLTINTSSTPTTATQGVPVTLTSLVKNIGNATTGPTGSTFYNFFQWTETYPGDENIISMNKNKFLNFFASLFKKVEASGNTVTYHNLDPRPMAAIGSGSSRNASSPSVTFESSGVFYYRACADKNNPSDLGTVSESLESNNCGPFTTITVMPSGNYPDLTADSVLQTAALPNVPTTLSAVIRNIGDKTTGIVFQDKFQITQENPNGGGISVSTDEITTTNPVLAASGASYTASASYTFPNTGIYYLRACADLPPPTPGVISESDEGNNCSPAWTIITVSNGSLPDLIALGITPTIATVGISTNFSFTIYNNGTASTGTGFYNFVHVSNGVISGNLVAYTPTALGPDQPRTISGAHTFTTAGTYYARACADKSNSSDPGTILESNENNNCGPITTIIVSDGNEVVNGECSSSHYDCTKGDSVNHKSGPIAWTWDCQGSNGGTTASCSETKPHNLPDLTADFIYPTVVMPMDMIEFSAKVINQGSVSTGDSFLNIFQMADGLDSNGLGINPEDILPARPIASLGANLSQIIKFDYMFNDPGVKYFRVCADENSMGDPGTITESDEDNNCGPWTMVTATDEQVDGSCASAHWFCSSGNSTHNEGNSTTGWTWMCEGVNGGADDACSQPVCPTGTTGTWPICTCDNGGSNPPDCDECPTGTTGTPPICTCTNTNWTNPPLCNECANPSFTNWPTCTGTGTADHCSNLVKDEDETGIDCGGKECKACGKIPKFIER